MAPKIIWEMVLKVMTNMERMDEDTAAFFTTLQLSHRGSYMALSRKVRRKERDVFYRMHKIADERLSELILQKYDPVIWEESSKALDNCGFSAEPFEMARWLYQNNVRWVAQFVQSRDKTPNG